MNGLYPSLPITQVSQVSLSRRAKECAQPPAQLRALDNVNLSRTISTKITIHPYSFLLPIPQKVTLHHNDPRSAIKLLGWLAPCVSHARIVRIPLSTSFLPNLTMVPGHFTRRIFRLLPQ